ncbi:hypothetical protein B0H16DRAFT_1745291 [Mycena metata]|uniref:Uncharacterized protein n=1 Tax=Mycena metata TaxID=1033252 RepID=A0AAD7MCX6_9AGAR|nr:hypothetical protein B0H16DRAFT_1745291 [Mycena metata]
MSPSTTINLTPNRSWAPSTRDPWPPAPPPSWVDNGDPTNLTWIHGTWYTDPSVKWPWSTNWNEWDGLMYYTETYKGKLKVEKMFQDVFNVGTIEPLAYVEDSHGEVFLFRAQGRYYLWNDYKLTVHRLEFTSPKEFLEHALENRPHQMPDVVVHPRRPGTRLGWF